MKNENGIISLKEKRPFAVFLVLSILTCGIYFIVFHCSLVKDLNIACAYVEKDAEKQSQNYLLVFLLGLITLGIYPLIWRYRQGNRMTEAGELYKIPMTENGKTYLLWTLPGFLLFAAGPAVAWYLFIGNADRLCRAYNYKVRQRTEQNDQKEGTTGGFVGTGFVVLENGSDVVMPLPLSNNESFCIMPYGMIKCVSGVFEGAELQIDPNDELILGRNSDLCQLVLPNKDVSKKHCTIKYSQLDGCYYVTDHSTFGTYMNRSMRLEKEVSRKCPAGTLLTLANGSNAFLLQ